MSEELKPCPWCGTEGELIQAGRTHFSFSQGHCPNCGACGPGKINQTDSEATEAWNTRAQLAAPAPQARDLRGMLRMIWQLAFETERFSDEDRQLALTQNSPLMQELDAYFDKNPWTPFDKTVAREKHSAGPGSEKRDWWLTKEQIEELRIEFIKKITDSEYSDADRNQLCAMALFALGAALEKQG